MMHSKPQPFTEKSSMLPFLLCGEKAHAAMPGLQGLPVLIVEQPCSTAARGQTLHLSISAKKEASELTET